MLKRYNADDPARKADLSGQDGDAGPDGPDGPDRGTDTDGLGGLDGGHLALRFDLLPAIDLRGGRVVRLERGDFARETAYADDPVAVAEGFAAAGVRWLHVVDLDGARDPDARQTAVVAGIVRAVGDRLSVEVAGGLRDASAVAAALDSGAARAVVGTAALRDPAFVGRLVRAHGPERVAVALDVRGGVAVGDGWIPGAAGMAVGEALGRLSAEGAGTFEITAIDRDGTLAGPDLAMLSSALHATDAAVIASAGIRSGDDIRAVRGLGCAGAIVGMALYAGQLRIEDALTAAE